MKILAIVGSPRLEGNTNYLVDQALDEAEKLGAQVEKIILSKHKVNPCLGHDNCASFKSCQQNDDMGWILDRLREADGIILATPVYFYNVSAQMKAFIDRNYFPYKHGQKYGAKMTGIIIVTGSEGIEDTLYTLRQFTGVVNVEKDRIFAVCGCASRIGDAENNLPLVEEARKLGQQMVASCQE